MHCVELARSYSTEKQEDKGHIRECSQTHNYMQTYTREMCWCVCVYSYNCAFVHMYVFVSIHTCVCVHVCVNVYTSKGMYLCECVSVYTYIDAYMHAYTHLHVFAYLIYKCTVQQQYFTMMMKPQAYVCVYIYIPSRHAHSFVRMHLCQSCRRWRLCSK